MVNGHVTLWGRDVKSFAFPDALKRLRSIMHMNRVLVFCVKEEGWMRLSIVPRLSEVLGHESWQFKKTL